MNSDRSLDCQHLLCPLPIVKLAALARQARQGEVIELLADDIGIREDLPAWCETTGNEFLGFEEDNGLIKGYLKISQADS